MQGPPPVHHSPLHTSAGAHSHLHDFRRMSKYDVATMGVQRDKSKPSNLGYWVGFSAHRTQLPLAAVPVSCTPAS